MSGAVGTASALRLIRGYPPVLGAMLLVDGVITMIMGGDAAVSAGEVVVYLLLPPLAMYLVTQSTGGRRPGAVALGVAVAAAVVLFAALFLGGGVQLMTMPAWVLAVVGLVFLGAAAALMAAAAADGTGGPAAAPLLSQSERDRFADGAEEDEYAAAPDGVDEFGARPGESGARSGPYGAGSGEFDGEPVEPAGAARGFGEFGGSDGEYGRGSAEYRGEYSAGSGGYDAPPEREWPPLRRDDAASAGYSGSPAADYSASRAADDTVAGLPPVPATQTAGPAEPEWPPMRDRAGSGSAWSDRDEFASDWSTGTRAAHAAPDDPPAGYPAGAGDSRSDWSAGSGEREWPPGPAGGEWPPRRDPEAESGAAQRSWFEPDEPPAEPGPATGSESGSGSSWSSGPADPEWPPSGSTYRSGGRRSRHSDE